jgi:hypothetical protein
VAGAVLLCTTVAWKHSPKQYVYTVCTFSGNMICFLVCPWFVHLLETWLENNVSWFVHLRETWLENNVSWFVHLLETWLENNVSWFVMHLRETWLGNNISWFAHAPSGNMTEKH